MRVIFLDFDGVLNSWALWNTPEYQALPPSERMHTVDREAVERLNQIVERTGCQVVISSTWRFLSPTETREKIEAFLIANGYRYRVFGTTPRDFNCDWHDGHCDQGHRGGEINQWLIEHSYIYVGQKFAIVDDGSDMGPLKDHLVQTTMADGLRDEHVEQIVKLLEVKDLGPYFNKVMSLNDNK